jgi:hypothetical protein
MRIRYMGVAPLVTPVAETPVRERYIYLHRVGRTADLLPAEMVSPPPLVRLESDVGLRPAVRRAPTAGEVLAAFTAEGIAETQAALLLAHIPEAAGEMRVVAVVSMGVEERPAVEPVPVAHHTAGAEVPLRAAAVPTNRRS